VQTEWDVALTLELLAQSPDKGGAVIGGFLMSWSDEYWKGASVEAHCNFPCKVADADRCRGEDIEWFTGGGAQCNEKAHFTCDNFDASYHDLCGYYLYAFPDHYVNEEWFGITTPVSCGVTGPAGGYHMDGLLVRPAFLAMQRVWKEGGYDHSIHDLQVTCAQLKPCHDCLMKYLPSQIHAGVCDPACSTKSPRALAHPKHHWHYPGFWQAFGILVTLTAVILLFCVSGLLYSYIRKRRLGRNERTPLLMA
jgi:hypothetical protein